MIYIVPFASLKALQRIAKIYGDHFASHLSAATFRMGTVAITMALEIFGVRRQRRQMEPSFLQSYCPGAVSKSDWKYRKSLRKMTNSGK